jgi:hypothetical protein
VNCVALIREILNAGAVSFHVCMPSACASYTFFLLESFLTTIPWSVPRIVELKSRISIRAR